MLWTIIVILLVLWLLGMGTAYTLGGLIHILLVIAVIVIVLRLSKAVDQSPKQARHLACDGGAWHFSVAVSFHSSSTRYSSYRFC
jgi:hypothetical protein